MLGRLSDRERGVIVRRFGLEGTCEKSLRPLGEEMGITKERARQIETRARKKLRKFALEEELDVDAGLTPRGPSEPLTETVPRGAPAAPGVPSHSIIAALREPTAEGATDGIVPVASAQLGSARSEAVVHASHILLPAPGSDPGSPESPR